jgi:biotin synthase
MIDSAWLSRRLSGGFADSDLKALLTSGQEEAEAAFRAAREVRREHFGNKAYIRAVIEFANRCRCNCHYCGMRKDNEGVERFLLPAETILEAARTAREAGIRTFFLQSAESDEYDAGWLASLISGISSMGMSVLLCVGVHGQGDLDLWRRAGARKFIMKHETADAGLFARLKPGLTLADRIAGLRDLREHGYSIGSGPLLGLPGQTVDTLVADLRLLETLGVEMSSVSVFLPAEGTPLSSCPPGDAGLGLRFIAAMRLLLRKTLIPATSTFERLMPGGQLQCFQAGANVITVNMTPPSVRNEYELYSERFFVSLEHARGVIRDAGLEEASEGMPD